MKQPEYFIQFDGCCGSLIIRRIGRRYHKLTHYMDGSMKWMRIRSPRKQLAHRLKLESIVEEA